MVYYLPILGAAALAGGTILERVILKKRKVEVKVYQTASFLSIIIFLVPFLFFFWKIDSQALNPKNILIFAIIIVFAFIANLLAFYSLKGEKVTSLEPARVLEPLFVIILTVIFSIFIDGLYRTSPKIILPAIIASLALVFSHLKKHHLKFNRFFIAMILASFFFALELVVSNLILDLYSPFSFYFIRCLFIFVLSLLFFSPDFNELDKKSTWITFITGGIWILYRVAIYYGYLKIGIIFTTLLLMLGSIFMYAFAHFFLKEKLSWKNIVAAIVIIGAVIYAIA